MFDEVSALLNTRLEFHEWQLKHHQKRIDEIQDMKQYLSAKFTVEAEPVAEASPEAVEAEAEPVMAEAETPEEPVTAEHETSENGQHAHQTTDHPYNQSMY
jgi:hypothetical protein